MKSSILMPVAAVAIAPKHSWDSLATMTFFHACNESGLYSDEALDVITKFPLVTVEKGQGFNDKTGRKAEEKIVEQLKAVKSRDPNIATVFYMNSVLDWYFYGMHDEYVQHKDWWLRYSSTGKPFYTSGDKTFNPPKEGMLVFDHSKAEVRQWWQDTCMQAVASGFVDGCFSDSSGPGSHGTNMALNATDKATFEAGKVATMAAVTAALGGQAGQPFEGSSGLLIGKVSSQLGINAFMIEMFHADAASIVELQAGATQGYLVQAHVSVNDAVTQCGCDCYTDHLAAFLVGAGDYSYFGSGTWISKSLGEVTRQWCPAIYDRPVGRPLSDAVLVAGRFERHFVSGTWVEFDTSTNKGSIHWADAPQPDCGKEVQFAGGISQSDITPTPWSEHTTESAEACCQQCWAEGDECVSWTWYSDGAKECHFHSSSKIRNTKSGRTSGVLRSESIPAIPVAV
eukprot:TRINITY_DN40705_c0_g1_i1.p1 TRINITY_DN40705_c0_g1~~TRINITY_DN40705_c0_g1_i1.p1  ORF type:complete len:475 (+),score=90.50 TRINITY_DN40705_c0_g1_i1:61-1425(+)